MMTGRNNLTTITYSSDDNNVFLNALRKIEASYQKEHPNNTTGTGGAAAGTASAAVVMDTPSKNIAIIDKNLACACVITLCKILDNIILEKKYNAKTRSIKLSNKLFKDKVGKVQGGVDFMIACKFTFNTVRPEQGYHSIQLKQQNEDRTMLIMGRKYLSEYGQKVLKLDIGKGKNELPPYLIRDELSTNLLEMIENGIMSLTVEEEKEEEEDTTISLNSGHDDDNLNSLEHEISSIIGDDCFDLETKELMEVIDNNSPLSVKKKGPPTPDMEISDYSNEGDNNRDFMNHPTSDMARYDKKEIHNVVVKNNNFVDRDIIDVTNDIATVDETLEKSQHSSTKSIGLESYGCKTDSSSLIDDAFNNKDMCASNHIHESFDFHNDDIKQIDIQCLSPEEKLSLKKLTSINLNGLDEHEAINSIIEGSTLNQESKQSRSYGFVSKLKIIAGGNENQVEEENKRNQDLVYETEALSKPPVTIKENEDVRQIYDSDDLISLSDDKAEIDYVEKINSINLGHLLSENIEALIRTGVKLFFVVFLEIFTGSPLNAERGCCPIDIVFRLWKAILRREKDLVDGITNRQIFEAFEAVVAGVSEDDYQIENFETMGGLDLKTCNFIKAALTSVDIITADSIDQYYIQDDMESGFTFTSIALTDGPYSSQRRREIANKIFPRIDEKSLKWHDIIIRGCKELLNCELTTEELYNDPEPSNRLSVWYATRYLPYHISSHGSYKDSLTLLLDKNFTIHRMNSCGCFEATTRHLKDTLITTKLMAEDDNENSVDLDYTQAASRAIKEQMLEILELKKKDVGDQLKKSNIMNQDDVYSCKRRALDIGSAMHKLGHSFGQTGLYQKEIDIYSEAVRLKTVSGCPESQVVNTLLSMSVCYRHLGNPLTALSRLNEVLKIETQLNGEIHPNIAALSQYKGLIQSEVGDYDEALFSFQTTLRIHKMLNIPSGIVLTLCSIGKVQQELGDYVLAIDSFQTAISSLDMIEQKGSLRHAEILQNIGIIYDKMNKPQESLHYLYEALSIRRSLLDDDNADVCDTLSTIAYVLKKKDVERSLSIYRVVLKMKLKHHKMKNAFECEDLLKAYLEVLFVVKEMLRTDNRNQDLQDEITLLFFSIGNLYEKLYMYKIAIGYYNKSLKIHKIRNNYYEIGNLLNSLGIAHAKRRSFKKAARCLSDCLSVRQLILGKRNIEVAETLHNMGNCCAKQNDYDSATIHYEQSLIIKRMADGESLSTAKTLHTIGLINEEIGLLDDAFEYFEDAYKIRLKALGENSLDVAISLHSIGIVHRKNDEIERAHKCLSSALKIKMHYYFKDHASIAETLVELAKTESKKGNFHEAINNYELALSIYQKSLGAHKSTVQILDSIGSLFLVTEQYDKAYRHLERALAMKRLLYGNDDEELSDTLHLIGKVQGKSGDIDDALDSLKEALRIRKKFYDDESLPVAVIINDVGVLQLRKNQYQIAKTCFTEALRVWKLKLVEDHDYHGEALLNLAEIDYLSDDYDDAIEKLTEALKVMRKRVGDRHASVGLVYYKLGLSFKAKELYVDALDALDRALMIRNDEYGRDSLPVAEVLKCIGTSCLAMGELAKARNYLGESLKIMSSLSPNHFDTADTLYYLGKVMLKMKYLDEAQTYFEEALEIRNRRLQSDDSFNANIFADLGILFEEKQQYDQSLNMHERALKIRIDLFGENALIGDSYHMIGVILQTMNDFTSALSNFGSALVVYQNVLGDDHLSCAKTMNNIAIVYEATNELDDSLKYHREALRIRKKNLGRDHLKVANSLDNVAGVYQKKSNVDKACAALKEALRIRIAKLGNDHLEVGTTLFGMGILYCDKGDLQRAMDCYEASLKIRKRRVGSSSIEVAQTMFNIGSLYAMKQDYINALNNWRNALGIYRMTLPDDHHMVACAIGNIQMAENVLSGGA